MGEDFADQLRRNRADLLVLPQEAFEKHAQFHYRVHFSDRYLVAVDKDYPEAGDTHTLEQFSWLPHLATSSGHLQSLAEMRLDFPGRTAQHPGGTGTRTMTTSYANDDGPPRVVRATTQPLSRGSASCTDRGRWSIG